MVYNIIILCSVFIYSMPGYSVSIKERMLYSSCKNAVTEVIEKFYKIPIAKKVEVESGSEVTEQFLQVLLRTGIFICAVFKDQCCGFGSAWIRIKWKGWIRIRIKVLSWIRIQRQCY
jgi:hypothetical protein